MALTHHQLGAVLAKQKKFPDAVNELKKAVKLDPTYPEVHLTLAYVYRQLGDRQNADVELNVFQKLKQTKKDGESASGSSQMSARPRQ